MSCKRLTLTNNEPSILFDTLFQIVADEEIADELYSYFRTEEFKDIFGDYTKATESMAHRLDDNMEPKLFVSNGKYFFLDKNNERVYYPYSRTGLQQYFTINDIRDFAKSLALNYYADNIEFNFDSLDFINVNGVSLSQYVTTYLDSKINELLDSDDSDLFAKGIALENTKNFTNEWVQRAKNFFSTLDLDYVEREDLVRKESFLKNSKNNVGNNIKLFLSLLESPKKNSFGDRTFIPFDDIYATLNKALANIVSFRDEDGRLQDPYDLYVDRIRELVSKKPYLEKLLDILTNDETLTNETFKNQFVSAFDLHKNNFLSSTITRNEDGTINHNVANISEVSSRKAVVISGWLENFNNKKLNKTAKNKIIKQAEAVKKDLLQSDTPTKVIPKVKDILKKVGIVSNPEALTMFVEEDFRNRFVYLLDGVIRGLEFSINNPTGNLFRNQNAFIDLADAEAFFFEEGTDASVYTLGKSKWVYSYPSYLSKKIQEWKADPESLIDHFESSSYNQGSYFMDYYVNNPEEIQNIELAIFDSVDDNDNKNISYLDSLVDYTNKVLAFRKGGKVYYKTPLAGDKSTEYQINFGNQLSVPVNVTINDNGTLTLDSLTLDIFYNYFKSEYNRIAEVQAEIQEGENLIKTYHTGLRRGLKSQLFPELSENRGDLILYDEEGIPSYEDLDQIEDEVKDIIETLISSRIKATQIILESNGVYGPRQIDSEIFNSYKDNKMLRVAADLWVNSTISMVEYSKMFAGDAAFYKDNLDFKKRIPGTYTDGLYPRVYDENGEYDPHFTASIITGVEVPVPTLDDMKKMLSKENYEKYSQVNTTDAQAWITPQRWKRLMHGLGKWSKAREATYQKMFTDNPQYTSDELRFLAQPLKGVYFDLQEGYRPVYLKYSQAVLLPNLIKDTPLQRVYDQMLKDGIDELITEDGIKAGSPVTTESHTADGQVKDTLDFSQSTLQLRNDLWKLQQDLPTKGITNRLIGSQIQKNIFQGLVYNLGENFNVDGKEFSGNDLIDHINEVYTALTNKGVTQVKNMFSLNDNFEIENEEVLYSSLIRQLRKRDVPDNVIAALERSISPYGIPGYIEVFQNVFSSVVNDRLVKLKTNGAGFIQMSDYGLTKSESENSKTGIRFTPWFETNSLTPPKIIGTKEDGTPIIEPGGIFISGSFIAKYVPNWKEKSDEELFGKNGIISPEILRNIIGYRIPNQSLASNDALQVMGILPEEMGDTIIPYVGMTTKTGSDFDIDKMYIMMPSFKVKFGKAQKIRDYVYNKLRGKNIQETIDNVSAILDEMDYDTSVDLSVDDLAQLMMAKSKSKLLTYEIDNLIQAILSDPKNSVAKEIAEKIPNFNDAVKLEYVPYDNKYSAEAQSKEQLQNRIISIYKTILTHPSVINDVMNPIDVDYIERDIKDLLPDLGNINEFDALADIELKIIYQQGKAGLGQNINSLVDAVRGSMADLKLLSPMPWADNKILLDDISGVELDKQFSKELTKQDIKGYNDTSNSELDLKKLKKVPLFTAMMGYVNGFVDIAKDDYVVRGNWTTYTNPVGFMLLRSGVHPFYVNALLAQPVIKEFIKFRNNLTSSISESDPSRAVVKYKLHKLIQFLPDETYGSITLKEIARRVLDTDFNNQMARLKTASEDKHIDVYNSIISDLNKKIKGITKGNIEDSISESIVELGQVIFNDPSSWYPAPLKTVREAAKQPAVTLENVQDQISFLNMFVSMRDPARSLTDSIRASRVDVDGKGRTISSHTVTNNLIHKVLVEDNGKVDKVMGYETKLKRNGKPTMLGSYTDAAIIYMGKVMERNPKYFHTAKKEVVITYNFISQLLEGTNLMRDDLATELDRAYYTYLMSGFLDLDSEYRKELLKDFPSEFKKFKKNYSDNLLLRELYVEKDAITISKVKKTVSFQNDLIDGWRELFELEPSFAEKLVQYSYLQSGFNKKLDSFHDLIPTEFFNSNRFNSFMQGMSEREDVVDMVFVDQFFRNNKSDKAKKVWPKIMKKISGDPKKNSAFVTEKNRGYLVYHSYQSSDKFGVPTMARKWYKLEGFDSNGHAVYTRTGLLNGSEYDMADPFYDSVNDKNVPRGRKWDVIERAEELSVLSLPEAYGFIEEAEEEDIFTKDC